MLSRGKSFRGTLRKTVDAAGMLWYNETKEVRPMDWETTTAQGLEDTNARYDAACKRVLSEKSIFQCDGEEENPAKRI